MEDELQTQAEILGEFIAALRITRPEILRVTQGRHALWQFGRILRERRTGRNLYEHSMQRTFIAQFWSHSWHGPVWSKIILLLAVCNSLPALFLGTVAFTATRILIQPYLGPLPLDHARGAGSSSYTNNVLALYSYYVHYCFLFLILFISMISLVLIIIIIIIGLIVLLYYRVVVLE